MDNSSQIQKSELINNFYKPVIRATELLNSGNFTSLFLVGKAGTGKSTIVNQALERIKANYLIFKGDISEARCYEFLQDNSAKIIVLRDVGRLLRRIGFIEMLKAATDPGEKRIVSRLTYANHEGVEDSFEFTGKIIMELNDIGNRYKEDLEALFSRGILIELNLSFEDIISLMKLICNTEEEILVTEYLVSKANLLGINSFNLRTQNLCFRVYNQAIKDKLDWRDEIGLFLNNSLSEGRKYLYRFTGTNPCLRLDFVKYLIKETKWSYCTCERRINEYKLLGEIYSNNLRKREILSINKFN
jgi:hypothetical protein